ncbi:MAG: cupin domain-containing protein [Pseudomonadota bacterium]|nr:cupin domain-containing protein [Pseudomonadota bacterium]
MLHPSFDIAAFLRDSWQKRPLLIKNPWADWQNPLAPDELAGLACEADVESRLIARNGGRANGRLVCEHGPIDATRFGRLGKKHWTLLVQAVDHHVPAVAALIEPFRFVPNWRIDDVMVSYAVDGGGVGAHFDQYDVFLIQGLGIRRWRVGQACDASTALLPHDDLRLLADFTPTAEYWLEPGDMLYLPPGTAHDGVAVGDDCMTYSIGFRAPACSELISDWADHVASQLPQDDRYTDPGLRLQDNPGEIAPDAIAALHGLVTAKLQDRAGFARWFGEFTTTPKYAEIDWRPDVPLESADLRQRLASAALHRNPASRFSFIRHGSDAVWLFVDGECFDCRDASAVFATRICANTALVVDAPVLSSDAALAVITQLYNQGSVSFDPA